MKKLYLMVLLNGLVFSICAQNFSWAKREGLWAYDYGYGIVNDNAGNVYVAGKYEENAVFSGTTLTSAGNHDMFLAKYSSAGAVDWIRTAGGNLGDYAHALAIDASNNLYAAGEIEGYGNTISFPGSPVNITCVGDNDAFVAKYDMNGTLLWAKSEGWKYSEKALAVTCDYLGNVYIAGYYTDTTMFDGIQLISKGGRDLYIAKYSPSGGFVWMQSAGSAGRDEALSIKCDPAGDVYVCGMHSDGAVFGTTTLSTGPTSYPDYDIFLAKYNSSGVMQWVKSPGSDYDDIAWSMTIDNAGTIFITGEYNAYAVFDGFALTTSGDADIFVASYDASGTVLWVKSAGGPVIDRARGIGCDGTNLYITGQYGSDTLGAPAMFNTFSLTAADSSDVFIAALNSSGDFLWATAVSGPADSVETLGYESGNAVCAEATGSIYATGAVLDGGVFGSTTFSEYARTDVFVAKLTQAGVAVPENASSGRVKFFPNPTTGKVTLDISYISGSADVVNIYNYLGQLVLSQSDVSNNSEFDLSSYNKGIYFIETICGQNNSRAKIVLQ